MNRLTRFALFALTALSLITPQVVRAQIPQTVFTYQNTYFRRTTAAANVARDPLWSHYPPGAASQSFTALTDSTVFRRTIITAATTALGVLADTTAAYDPSLWLQPPTYAAHGAAIGQRATKHAAGAQEGYTDSTVVDTADTTPWIVVRVRTDTLAYAWTGAAGFDTAAVTAQWSPDKGATWINIGTPTRLFYASQVTGTAEDGTTPPFIIGVERNGAADLAYIPFRCYPNLMASTNTSTVDDRTLCMCGGLIRFIVYVSNDASGQFAVDIGSWTYQGNPTYQSSGR